MGIVKAYDIRGIVGTEIDQYTAHSVGRSVVSLLNAKNVLLAQDMRTHSPALAYALKYGIIAQGADAICLGLSSTPQFYYTLAAGVYDAGIMITASHNPKEYNGFKICGKGAFPISYGNGLADLEKMIQEKNWPKSGIGKFVDCRDSRDAYARFVQSCVPLQQSHTLVFDTGNAMEGHTLPALLSCYPMITALHLYPELDGSFPNHEANPMKEETLSVLKQKVVETKAELGIGFDGDADRVGFVDELGQFISSDFAFCVIATHYLADHPGAPIIYDIRSTRALPEAIEAAGGKPVIWKGGHSLIKLKMRELDAPRAAEKSGHFFFKESFYGEGIDLAWLSVVQIMEKTGKKLSELVAPHKKYYGGPEINYPVPVDPLIVLKKIENAYPLGKSMYLDGLSLDMGNWWCNVRPSNTEPLLRLNLEAKTPEIYEEKKEELSKLITSL